MKTGFAARVALTYRGATPEMKRREFAYAWLLEIDDHDKEHSHTSGGHAFPCTREQLETLRAQIDALLVEADARPAL